MTQTLHEYIHVRFNALSLSLSLYIYKILYIYIQNTKTFPKCYVGRNGKRNQQQLHIHVKCVDRSRHNGIKGAKAKINVHTNQILAHTFSHGTLDSVVS